jgi:hypothetical protein
MTAPPTPSRSDETTRKTDLNLLHVAAAALAAVTTAVLGSELGADGTLIGAAGASVITTVGTAMYQASLERSRKRVRSLAQRARPLPTSREGSRTEISHRTPADAPLGDEGLTDSTDRRTQPGNRLRRFATLRWGAVAVGALGAFLLAMIVITGFEWANGQTVGGNGNGTTIGHVINNQPAPRKPDTPPSPGAPPSESPTSSTPTETTTPPTSTSTPDGSTDEQSPTNTSGSTPPSKATPTPPLIQIPGVGG